MPVTSFCGGDAGQWRITTHHAVIGAPLPPASHVAIDQPGPGAAWSLAGTSNHARYTTRAEKALLDPVSAPLGRAGSRRAALIPIRKTAEWWALAQDERRAIYEASDHLGIGLDYLPAVARRLYHCRDLAGPFDFLTWFEFAADDEAAFDNMLVRLRATPEWRYVDREVDIRLSIA